VTVKRLTDEEKDAARAEAHRCVVCFSPYDEKERAALRVYPDGCTAHDACDMSGRGRGMRHWHDKTEMCGRCEQRPPTTDIGYWVCGECAAEVAAL
jgi:hypothetical protein